MDKNHVAESVLKGVLGTCIVGTIAAALGSAFVSSSQKNQEAHSIYTRVVQPVLNRNCAPDGSQVSNAFRDEGVNVVLATKLLLRHPEKMKEICAIVNAQDTRRANRVALNNLATSLDVDTSIFKTHHHFEPVVMINELGIEAFK